MADEKPKITEKPMKPETGKYYKCADGCKAYVGYIREDGVAVGHKYRHGSQTIYSIEQWDEKGRAISGIGICSRNLIAEWVEPKPVEVWLNVFKTGTRSLTHWTRDSALSVAEEALYTIGLRLWPDRDPEVIERIVHGEGSDGRRR